MHNFLKMKKFTIKLIVIYLIVGFLWLISGSWLINELKSLTPDADIQFLFDLKNLLFLIISIVSIVFILNKRYGSLLLKEQILNRKLINREQQLNKVVGNYEMVTKATNDLIWEYDLLKDELKWHYGYKELFGYEDDVIMKATFWNMQRIHPQDRDDAILLFRKLLKSQQLTWKTEYRYLCKDGSYKYVSDRGYVIRDAAKVAVRLIGAMQNIDQEKTYSNLLQEQNERLREIAWLNSHEIRRPLSNVAGLVPVIKSSLHDTTELSHLILLLETSVKELDDAVYKVNKQTNMLDS